MTEMAPEQIVPDIGNLMVAANVDTNEVAIEMSLDNEIVVILAFPNEGTPVDRTKVAQLLGMAQQAIPEILNQMEAPA
jgi:hypothetical protein